MTLCEIPNSFVTDISFTIWVDLKNKNHNHVFTYLMCHARHFNAQSVDTCTDVLTIVYLGQCVYLYVYINAFINWHCKCSLYFQKHPYHFMCIVSVIKTINDFLSMCIETV